MTGIAKTTKHRMAWLAVALLPLGVACGSAQTEPLEAPDVPTDEEEAQLAPNGSWVSLTGTVVETDDDAFTLDYGDGRITVEMDDWDWVPEARHLMIDDHVVVYGFIDDDFLERRTVEASSVYVRDLGTQFYASGVDEEDIPTVTVMEIEPRVELTGTVTEVSGDELTLDTGGGELTVDTAAMRYDPLDQEGYQQVSAGDRVRVTGELTTGLFDDRDLVADTIVTLQPSSSS